jgi:hypothetical protein
MTDISAERLSQLAALADRLPASYRVAAFQELVRHELNRGTIAEPRDPAGSMKNSSNGGVDTPPELPGWFMELLGNMPDRDVFAEGGRDAQAAWALVELYRRGEPATVATIRELIRVELGETPERREHMSNRLGRDFTPRYADRLQHEGRSFRYEPTRRIVEMFPSIEEVE